MADETSSVTPSWPSVVIDSGEDDERGAEDKGGKSLADTRGMWLSDEQDDGGILDRFLKVQQFKELKMASMESDGMPSIAPIDEGDKMSELNSMVGDDDDIPAPESVLETEDEDEEEEDPMQTSVIFRPSGSGVEEIKSVSPVDDLTVDEDPNPIVSSMESLTSLIPAEKREEMDRFEESLKEMIRDAKDSEREELLKQQQQQLQQQQQQQQQLRQKKSPSVQSTTESVVSVIEAPPQVTQPAMQQLQQQQQQQQQEQQRPWLDLGHEDGSRLQDVRDLDAETLEFQQRVLEAGRKKRRATLGDGGETVAAEAEEARDGEPWQRREQQQQHQQQQQRWTNNQRRPDTQTDPVDVEDGSSVVRNRYDEIISAGSRLSRERSLTRSQSDVRGTGSGMATEADQTRAARSIDSPPMFNNLPTAVRHGRESPLMVGFTSRKVQQQQQQQPPPPSQPSLQQQQTQQQMLENNNNQVPIFSAPTSTFKPGPIQVCTDPTVEPTPLPDPLVEGSGGAFKIRLPESFPSWFLITYTYSLVIVLILLTANMVPDGKLYIHLTAFWSVLIYAMLDDADGGGGPAGSAAGQVAAVTAARRDPIDTVVEGFVRKP